MLVCFFIRNNIVAQLFCSYHQVSSKDHGSALASTPSLTRNYTRNVWLSLCGAMGYRTKAWCDEDVMTHARTLARTYVTHYAVCWIRCLLDPSSRAYLAAPLSVGSRCCLLAPAAPPLSVGPRGPPRLASSPGGADSRVRAASLLLLDSNPVDLCGIPFSSIQLHRGAQLTSAMSRRREERRRRHGQ